jgi:hypothetical protein
MADVQPRNLKYANFFKHENKRKLSSNKFYLSIFCVILALGIAFNVLADDFTQHNIFHVN